MRMRSRTRTTLIAVGLALLAGVPLLIESRGSILASLWGVKCCGEVPWLVGGLAAVLLVGAAVVAEVLLRHD
jgi:hypothetical protein